MVKVTAFFPARLTGQVEIAHRHDFRNAAKNFQRNTEAGSWRVFGRRVGCGPARGESQ